ncbi:MAG: rRNA pseudouridine synthase [Lachnospiraceae bacterium]|nr:rRNA pseudouridine synthase [Lachnospiraceae bacterium]
MMRLDKFLSETGFGTRSQVKALLKKGLVSVNGEPEKRPERKVDEYADTVFCGGKEAVYREFTYLMLYKPAGVLTARSDRRERTVFDLIPAELRRELSPVGRLDKDTEGLLLLTDNGALAHHLLSPRHHVDKRYFARVRGTLREADILRFQEGLDIGDERMTLTAKLEIQKSGAQSEALVTLHEGRYHQVKRMFQALGCEVLYLKRLSMGSLALDESLAPGEWRRLSEEEITLLKKEEGTRDGAGDAN